MNFIIHTSYADRIYYNVDWGSNGDRKNDYYYHIEYQSEVNLVCTVDSHQNISMVIWYRRVENSSHSIPLSTTIWGSAQYIRVDEYADKSNATIFKFAGFFEGYYFCAAFGNNYSLVGTPDINLTLLPPSS